MRHHLILRVITKLLVGTIFLFALYVQFHGDYSPGGGPSRRDYGRWVYHLRIGVQLKKALGKCSTLLVHKLLAFGVLLYACTGIYSLFMGYAYLDYAAIDPQHPSHGQHLGILIVEAGVGITVTGVMVAIYYAFAARAPILSDEDW